MHELRSAEALAQLELLRCAPCWNCVVRGGHPAGDLRLGLHRLRLGELSEIRTADLQFTRAGGAELLMAAGKYTSPPEPALAMLHESEPEGWARGRGWRRCRWPGTKIRSGSRRSSQAANGQWPTTRWPRCWSGSPMRCGGCSCGPGPAGVRPAGRCADRRLRANEQAGGAGAGQSCVRGIAGRGRSLVPLPSPVRRPAAAGVAAHHAGRGHRNARGSRRVVRGARVLGGGDPPSAQAAQDWGLAARLLADNWPGLHLGGQAATRAT